MGCDIHCYIEYRQAGESRWQSFGGRINPGRNYVLFGYLAGVRAMGPPIVEPRGMPPDAGWNSIDDNTLWISETEHEGYTTPERAAYYVEKCGSAYVSDKQRVTHPDWHTHSWMTAKEWEQAVTLTKKKEWKWGLPEMMAITACLYELAKYGESRVVFWFDN